MAGNTEESARFKKAFQTVGGGDNNKTLDKNFNDEMFKEAGATTEANLNNDTKSADSAIERDLETKGYTTRATDAELDETQELREKLSKRGNDPQKPAPES